MQLSKIPCELSLSLNNYSISKVLNCNIIERYDKLLKIQNYSLLLLHLHLGRRLACIFY